MLSGLLTALVLNPSPLWEDMQSPLFNDVFLVNLRMMRGTSMVQSFEELLQFKSAENDGFIVPSLWA